jgi:hypothetical protein
MEVKNRISIALAIASLCVAHTSAWAGDGDVYGNQLQVRGAYSSLIDDRGGEVFTDTGGANGTTNDDNGGYSIAAVLDLSAMEIKDLGGLRLMGEIFVEYSLFSDKVVRQTTSALLSGTNDSNVAVSALNVTIAPKARFDDLGSGRIRPFVIPIGIAFLVNSPPSNDSTYLDIGLHFGGGLDCLVTDRVSVGWDARYTHGFEQTNTNTSYWSTGAYVALNF